MQKRIAPNSNFTNTEKTAPMDGRAARAQRSRRAVASAALDLLEEGVVEATAAQIASRAKVSERLVFYHFKDLEALYAAVAQVQMGRLMPLIEPVDPTTPFENRLARFVEMRARFFERVSPARRATLRREPFSPVMAKGLARSHQVMRNLALSAFSRELAALPAEQSEEISHALSAATSWENWECLRRRERLSISAASKVMERMINALVGPAASGARPANNGS
jgi:TetR/AcrR family transcriptional regulator, regulator of autoinduction and epiphytic fitness